MISFLEQLAEELLKNFSVNNDLSSTAVVFPTRRAGLFFRKELSLKIRTPVWMPAVFSIQDFIRTNIKEAIPDLLTLQVELFHVYRKYFPEEQFSTFLPWAEILLKDFEEADRYLVNASSFFRNISDLKEVEESFGLAEEDEERVRDFWKSFYNKDQGNLKKNFYYSWQHLEAIYHDFRDVLTKQGLAYEGMAYRSFWESLQLGKFVLPYSHVVFAGLYALSKSEESIIEYLVKQGRASLYWDTDAYYTDDEKQEAGAFIRRNKLIRAAGYQWKQNHFEREPKQITVVGVPLQVGQARSAGQIIDSLVREKNVDPERIAVLLADEKLLFPFLYSLPESVDAVNVTMGFPLKDTPVFHLVESLMLLQKNYRSEKKGDTFYHKNVASILSHPYVQLAEPDFCAQWFRQFREKKWMRVPAGDLVHAQSPPLLKLIFLHATGGGLCDYLLKILDNLLHHARSRKSRHHTIEREYLFLFYTQVNRLKDLLPRIDANIESETFWYMLRQIIGQVKIPFAGEPLQGLQVMGLLESRLLDFEYLVFLSVNEDLLPAASTRVSYIPYGIRKSFGLPSHEENHAVSAYHFFRLLQRASGISILYNTESGSLSSGERSRFISQIQLELAKKYPGTIQYEEQLLLPGVHSTQVSPVVMEKTEAVLKSMEKFLANGKSAHAFTRKLSPSALSTYIHCSLKFYFSYVAGLREPEEIEDEIDARVFGEVLHHAMQNLYREGMQYTKDDVEDLLKKTGVAVDNAIGEIYRTEADRLEGKNIILRNVLLHLVGEIVKQDSLQTPFTIRQLEKNLIFPFAISGGRSVYIGGIADRVDEHLGTFRILDYKTGKVELRSLEELQDLFTDIRHKERLQTFIYAWLYRNSTGQENIRSGLYVARQLSDGIVYVNDGNVFSAEQMHEFEKHLRHLLDEMYNPSIPFVQTEDVRRCRYCPFIEICNR